MSQPSKSPQQIEAMRQGGKILATILRDVCAYTQAGMTEREVDAWVGKEIAARGAIATYKTSAANFPGNICISVNDQIVHSPASDYVFEVGDVVSFDLVIEYKGMKTDAAVTMVVGEEPKGAVKHLMSATENSLKAGIEAINGSGTKTGDIGAAVESVLKKAKLGIMRELVGHGVGLEMHMPPEVPNWGKRGSGAVLAAGATIAIEPMASLGGERIVTDPNDGWTISTRDGSLAAHFEHTVLITEDGAEILTKIQN